MDPLTHSLVGAALAQASRRRLGPTEAAALLIGANLPDLDALSYLVSQDLAFGFRRGWTHGMIGIVVGTLLLAGALWAVDRFARSRWGGGGSGPPFAVLLQLAAIAVVSHPLLDWLNTYGVRFLMPFSDRWFYGDALFIIDPWVWLLLGGAVFLSRAAIGFLESLGWVALTLLTSALMLGTGMAPVGARAIWVGGVLALALGRWFLMKASPPESSLGYAEFTGTPRVARTGLLLAGLYAAAMVAASWTASMMIQGQLAREEPAALDALMVSPVACNPMRWDVVAQTREEYRRARWHWLGRPQLSLIDERIARPPATPIVRDALASPSVRGTMRWMRFPSVEVEPDPAGPDRWIVRIMDLRYVRDRREGFGVARVTVSRTEP